jgi:hypothetical protein
MFCENWNGKVNSTSDFNENDIFEIIPEFLKICRKNKESLVIHQELKKNI